MYTYTRTFKTPIVAREKTWQNMVAYGNGRVATVGFFFPVLNIITLYDYYEIHPSRPHAPTAGER